MKKYFLAILSIFFLSSVGCASSKTGGLRKDAPTAFDENDREQIRTERMLMFNLNHI